jgi:7-cyano-7-deazaguanine synthase in queuosine biosynthesis
MSDPACILFSGGADSTLAAVLTAENHRPIHLLTFRHCHMSQMDKTEKAAARLIEKFGKENVIHRCLDMTDIWRKIGRAKRYCGFRRSGAYAMVLKTCVACKTAMHLMAAAYCLKNEISHLADGAHPSGSRLFPEQAAGPIETLRVFHREQGIDYSSPVYNIDRPDFMLHDLGISEKRNTKDEHLYYTNQFACHIGLIPYFYWYAIHPLFGRKKNIMDMTSSYLTLALMIEPVVSPKLLELDDGS